MLLKKRYQSLGSLGTRVEWNPFNRSNSKTGFLWGLDYPTIGWHVMVGFDDALNILENPTRRDILRHLVKEPHYPLQLSELLEVSQQAVVKHLRVLEEAGFVDSESKKSDKEGPLERFTGLINHFLLGLILGLTYSEQNIEKCRKEVLTILRVLFQKGLVRY